MYHLYTVDIICTGLPLTDLNTLEFEHPDKETGGQQTAHVQLYVFNCSECFLMFSRK